MSIKNFAEKYITAWKGAILNGDIATFEALFDHNFVYHYPGMDVGLGAYPRQHIVELREHSQIIQVDVEYLISERNIFAVDFRGHFKITSEMPGFPGSVGKEAKSNYLCLLRFSKDKVIEGWSNGTVIVG
jgi:hypothetical protein